MSGRAPRAVLFDLDGTFADTAADLARAANVLRARRNLAPLPNSAYRPEVSNGGRGMVRVAFGVTPDAPDFTSLRDEFLAAYADAICVDSVIFDGINEVVAALEARKIAWGIVTNKHTRFTTPLVKALGIDTRAACIVSGDTTAHAKPHPAPLLHAATQIGVAPEDCWYVGDDERDITAANAANMKSIIAHYGYLGGTDPATWKADTGIYSPLELLQTHPTFMT